jgi:catechol 2,3-dioxygenase-like lactoylglutathione lyase family enzyme
MRNWTGKCAFFAAGILVGVFLMQQSNAQQNAAPGLRLNHVGIYAKDYNESLRFYTQTMGFHEAFTIKDKDGNPTLTYLQINRDQFLELAPANAQRPAGLSHVGIWPLDLKATVSALRQHGAQVEDPRTGSTLTSITSVTDPNGVRLELLDFLPGSLPRKAIDEWK